MNNRLDFRIGDTPLCRKVEQFGLFNFMELAEHVRALPYRRIGNPVMTAVLEEGGGTCSTKHQLLAVVAHASGHAEFRLAIGIYKMSERNTPGIGDVLDDASLPYIPEAHCYLAVHGERLDFTGLPPGRESAFDSLLVERCVSPDELPSAKRSFHRQYLSRWADARGLLLEDVWRVREACISALSA